MLNIKRINQVKKIFPNWFCKKNGYYNFIHEMRETQKHVYYGILKDFFRDYCFGYPFKMDEIIERKNGYFNQIEKLKQNNSQEVVIDNIKRIINEIDEAVDFIENFKTSNESFSDSHIMKFDNFINEAYVSKEKMKEVQEEVKRTFPEFKFSIVRRHYSSIDVHILSGPIELTDKENGYEQVNTYYIQEHYKDNPETAEFLQKLYDIINKGNYDRSDIMTDYFDVGFYVNITIGRWDKPYVVDKTYKRKVKPDQNGNLMNFESFTNRLK